MLNRSTSVAGSSSVTSGNWKDLSFLQVLMKECLGRDGSVSGVEDLRHVARAMAARGSVEATGNELTSIGTGAFFKCVVQPYAVKAEAAELLRKAENKWAKAEDLMAAEVGRMAEALEQLLPHNLFTRKRADVKGASIHLPGFIKHLATQGNEKKIFASRKAGGKSEYSVAILLDVSASMAQGRKQACAVQTVLMLIGALKQMSIEAFSLILFGERIYPVKLPEIPWEDASVAVLLSLLQRHEQATMDADALLFAGQVMEESGSRGPKKMFVVTDGYGSSGVKLAAALIRMEEMGIDVVAMGVGPEHFFVKKCYGAWVTAALPQLVPDALESLTEKIDASSASRSTRQDDLIDWLSASLFPEGAAESIEEVLLNRREAFPDLLSMMKTEREAKLLRGNRPAFSKVDICFAMDCTGSMGPWIKAAKMQIQGIAAHVAEKIKEKVPDIELEFRFGMVAYRDHDDEDAIRVQPLCGEVGQLHQFLASLEAVSGADMPENVLGALDTVADSMGWEASTRFCVLIADAPGHGRDLNDCSDDRYADGDPNGLTAKGVMEKLMEQEIHLLFCRITQLTDKMIHQFALHYSDGSNFELVSKDAFGDVQVNGQLGYHFVFCLDESGSMSGKPWTDLENAFHHFLQSSARQILGRQPLSLGLRLGEQNNGGTSFVPPLEMARKELVARRQATDIPILIFMSDGAASGTEVHAIMAKMREIVQDCGPLSFHTVGFGASAGHVLLQAMAVEAGGMHHKAADGDDLSTTFHNIAVNNDTTEALASQFGKVIGETVASAIIIEHL